MLLTHGRCWRRVLQVKMANHGHFRLNIALMLIGLTFTLALAGIVGAGAGQTVPGQATQQATGEPRTGPGARFRQLNLRARLPRRPRLRFRTLQARFVTHAYAFCDTTSPSDTTA
jgi:hypothetical protein